MGREEEPGISLRQTGSTAPFLFSNIDVRGKLGFSLPNSILKCADLTGLEALLRNRVTTRSRLFLLLDKRASLFYEDEVVEKCAQFFLRPYRVLTLYV